MRVALVVTCFFILFSASAQIQKGKVALSASLDIENAKSSYSNGPDPVKGTNFGIGIGAGTFISNRLMAGLQIGYTKMKQTRVSLSSAHEATSQVIPIGAEFKWFKKLGGNFYWNITGAPVYTKMKIKETDNSSGQLQEATIDGHTLSARISPLQLTYLISNRFMIEGGFAYIEYSTGKTTTSYPMYGSAFTSDTKFTDFHVNLTPSTAKFTVSILL